MGLPSLGLFGYVVYIERVVWLFWKRAGELVLPVPEKADVLEGRCCGYPLCPVCPSPQTSAAAAKGFAPKLPASPRGLCCAT